MRSRKSSQRNSTRSKDAPRSLHFDVHKVEEDIVTYENMGEYVSLKNNCCLNFDIKPDAKDYFRECSQYLTDHPREVVMTSFDRREPEGVLECGFRYLSGLGVRQKSLQGALFVFESLTDRDTAGENYIGDTASISIRAQAHSAAAIANWQLWLTTDPDELAQIEADRQRFQRPRMPPFGYSISAAWHANRSVQLGLVSSAVLMVGFGTNDLAEQAGRNSVHAAQYRPLWRACTKRETEILDEERKRQGKIAKDEKAYICAAEGCKVEGMHKAALRSCSGRCPPDLKPHYCSPECQRKDWSRHKAICKPGRSGKTRVIPDADKEEYLNSFMGSDSSPAAGPSTHGENEADLGGELIEGITANGLEHVIEVPGENDQNVRLISSTLLPTELRKLREQLTR